jgi:hypothetical protein
MYRKLNIKILTAIFTALLVIVILVELADSRKGGRTFREDLVEVEAGEVTSMEIFPKVAGGEMIKLTRQDEMWFAESEGNRYNADGAMVGSMISELNRVQPESVVATEESRWEQYEVTDSLGTRIKLYNGQEVLADLIIGKFSFSQPRKMTSYVRINGEDEVYGVDGMLGMSFNRNLNSFRDRTVISSSVADWSKLTFSYPADSSFVLQKAGDGWMVDGQPADSVAVEEYFSSLGNLSNGQFAEEEPSGTVTHRLVIEGNNEMQPIEITGYYIDEENFIVESSHNRGNFFNSTDLANTIFISGNKFIK